MGFLMRCRDVVKRIVPKVAIVSGLSGVIGAAVPVLVEVVRGSDPESSKRHHMDQTGCVLETRGQRWSHVQPNLVLSKRLVSMVLGTIGVTGDSAPHSVAAE